MQVPCALIIELNVTHLRRRGRRRRRDTLTKRLQSVHVDANKDIAGKRTAGATTSTTGAAPVASPQNQPSAPVAAASSAAITAVPVGLMPGLPPTLPASVSRLFARPAAADESEVQVVEEPGVAARERSFYAEDAVLQASVLIERYIAREEAALLLSAAWRMVKLRREAVALERESVREFREAVELDEELQSMREQSTRDEGSEGGGSIAAVFADPSSALMSASASPAGAPAAAATLPQRTRILEDHFKGFLGKEYKAAAAAARAECRERSTRQRSPQGAQGGRERAKSAGPAGLAIPDLEARAQRKAEAAERARGVAEAARAAAEQARARALERVAAARRRRELSEAGSHQELASLASSFI